MNRAKFIGLLLIAGWLSGQRTVALGQETISVPLSPPPEETTANPNALPTPQLLRVEVDLTTGGFGAVRIPLDPTWVAVTRPTLGVSQLRTDAGGDAEVVPPLEGGAEELQHALEQALDRAQPAGTSSR